MTTRTDIDYQAGIAKRAADIHEFDAGIARASAWLAEHPEANDFFRKEMGDVLRNMTARRKRAASYAAELELREKLAMRWVDKNARLKDVATREEIAQLALYEQQSDLDQALM